MLLRVGFHDLWMGFLMTKSWQFIISVLLFNTLLLRDLDCSIWDFSFDVCINFSNNKNICFVKFSRTWNWALINWWKNFDVSKIDISNATALTKLRLWTLYSFLSLSTRWSWWWATNRWFYGLTFLWRQELIHFYHLFASLWRRRIEHSFIVQERTVIGAERVLSLRCSLAYGSCML